MRRAGRALFGPAVLLFLFPTLTGAAEPGLSAGDARLEPVPFEALQGWADDDHQAALETFRKSCTAIADGREAARSAQPPSEDLRRACEFARDPEPSGGARAFFERQFRAFEVVLPAGRGFLTGYFEPEYDGSLDQTESFPVPLLARPDDLVAVPRGESWPGIEGLQAGRRRPSGYEPYPDRAAIEDGALGPLAKAILFLRDPVDAMIVHVQGSARIRLPDGRTVRVAYAGKNGHPFTAVGRLMVERGYLPLPEMSLERMTAWLKSHPGEAREMLRLNRSYIFFRLADELDPADGPLGGAGVPLTAGRSLAVDRNLWSYGLPFWLEAEAPSPDGDADRLARLTVAQDTGSAILGPARGDLFMGSGPDAGTRAGLMRHKTRFVVLLPQPAP